MNILVTGANGQLGNEMRRVFVNSFFMNIINPCYMTHLNTYLMYNKC